MTDKKQKALDYFNSPEYQELMEKMEQHRLKYDAECEDFWKNLPYDDKLKVFHAVVKRIVQAEMIDRGSYRWALYDVFDFGPEAYALGMDCGYMDLHNAIYTKEDLDAVREYAVKKAMENDDTKDT